MIPAEVRQACTWNPDDQATLSVYSDLFGGSVEVWFLPDFDSGRLITDRMVVVLNDFLALTAADLPAVKQYLWADCLDSFDDIDYGVEPAAGETLRQANQRDFNIYSADDAYAQSHLVRLAIPEKPTLRHRYGAIEFEPEWASHGYSIIMQDGRLIATYSNDWYFSRYETDTPST